MRKQVCSTCSFSNADHGQCTYAFSPVLSLYSPNKDFNLECSKLPQEVVYASNGSVLNIFRLKNGTATLVEQVCPFAERKSSIYGIVSTVDYGKRLAIYGERSLVLYYDEYPCRPISAIHNFSDWIQTAIFLSDGSLAVLFGCNATVLFHIKEINFSQNVLELVEIVRVQSEHKAVLSHAVMFGTEWKNLKTFVGTAFGDILISIPAQGSAVLFRLSNHTGMIFGLCLIDKHLFSISDDRKLVMWDVENYALIDSAYGHSTRPFAVCKGPNGTVITGCQDSYIYIWNAELFKLNLLQKIAIGRGSIRSLLLLNNFLLMGTETGFFGSVSLSQSNNTKSFRFKHDLPIRNFCCISPEVQYFIDDDGFLYKKVKKIIIQVPGFKFYKAEFISVSKCRRFIAIADSFCCWLIDANNGAKVSQIEYGENVRILSCHWSSSHLFLFYNIGTVKHFVVNMTDGLLEKPEFNIGTKHYANVVLVENMTIIVGTKKGKILLIQDEQIVSVISAHQKEAVTDLIVYHKDLYSIGRDGKICKWDYRQNFLHKVKLIERERPSQTVVIEWPCKFLIFKNSLYIAGFHGAVFYLVNYDTGQCVCQFTCGGGHRNWEIVLLEEFGTSAAHYCYLCFINKGYMVETILKLYEMAIFTSNAHVSTMTGVCNLMSKHNKSIILTASFDTTVAASSINIENAMVSVLCRSRAHTSSVYSLSSLEHYAISAGGKSELCLWSAQQGNSLLKIDEMKLNPGCRLVSVSLYSVQPISFVVSGSDGRLLAIDRLGTPENPQNEILELHNYISKHFLYTKVCAIKEAGQVTIFATTTAGVLVYWPNINVPNHFLECFVEKAGLSALDGKHFGLNSVAVVGSESGCITTVKFSVESATDHIYWHGATCTDLKFFETSSRGVYVLSTSIDCRLAMFQYNESTNKLTFCRSFVLNIADPSSICLLKDSDSVVSTAVVVGFGLQTVQISKFL